MYLISIRSAPANENSLLQKGKISIKIQVATLRGDFHILTLELKRFYSRSFTATKKQKALHN